MPQRERRIADAIQREVADILIREVSDPRVSFLSVVSVKVTKDLKHAVIYCSILGDDRREKATLDALRKATGYIKRLLAQRIRLKFMPEMTFETEKLLRQERSIDEVLKEWESEGKNI